MLLCLHIFTTEQLGASDGPAASSRNNRGKPELRLLSAFCSVWRAEIVHSARQSQGSQVQASI
jgi:hypothetical protein